MYVQMCHLVTDPSVDVQKMAHQLLQQAAIRRTEHLVVEAGVDSENMVVIELPAELVVLLQNIINFEIDVGEVNTGGQDPLAYLLGWMITFDLFTDAVSAPVFDFDASANAFRSPSKLKLLTLISCGTWISSGATSCQIYLTFWG
jgi:hypothetical protein